MSIKKSFYNLIPNVSRDELNDWFDLGVRLGVKKEKLILTLCMQYDLYFNSSLAKNIGTLGAYIKDISTFPQYTGKKFKDSIIILNENMKEFDSELLKKELNIFKNVGGFVSINGYEKDIENLQMLDKAKVKLNLLSALQNEQELLLSKMKKSMDEDNIGTYKNLVMALKEITYLVQKEEEKTKYKEMYIDFGKDVAYIYFNGFVYSVKGDNIIEKVVNQVKRISGNERGVMIFVESVGCGNLIYDTLKYIEGFENTRYIFIDTIN